ncbi:MAG TPA: asparagine synthase-related protein [Gemmatimonadaceae bacterium]|nr:asparagine synthase-related protein [Gemmatimonadaceae bacterium]
MSGYAVVVRHPQATVKGEELRALVPALVRRGPHGTSVVTDGPIGLVTTLLDTGDRRLVPAWVIAGPFIVAGQVRVDEREALVDALRGDGTNASVHDPDIRLFAQAWLAWGDDAPSRVLGDYSVAVHDRESHATTLVRDPFGVRMLYYHLDATRLVVSNTLGAILDAGVPRDLNEDAIADFVAEGYNEDPATTVYRAVRRVPPAHTLRLHPDGREETRRYWTLPAPPIDRTRDAAAIVAEFRAVLEASVRDRIRSPSLVVFMSGGLDSTTLAALAVREVEHRTRLIARTSHLPTLLPTDDEKRRARIVADSLGIPHVITDVDGYGYREGTWLAGPDTPEPVSDPDVLALQDELRRASAHSPVAFWGEDPDSLLAPAHLGDLLRGSSAWRVALDALGYMLREHRRPYLAVRDLVRGRTPGQPQAAEESGPPWLRAELRARRAARVRQRELPSHRTRSEVARRLDATHWQPFLESLDAGVHGVPIDVRLPFLDRRLIELSLSLPSIPWMQRKYVLREAVKGLVPDVARCAPKQGLAGLYEARLAQWRDRGPAPFTPGEAFARFVDVSAIPPIDSTSSVNDQLVHLRLRLLDRWLRVHAPSTADAG